MPEPRASVEVEAPAAKRPRKEQQLQVEVNGDLTDHQVSRNLPGTGIIERLEQRVAHLETALGSRHANDDSADNGRTRDAEPKGTTLSSRRGLPTISRQRSTASVFPDASTFMRCLGSKEQGNHRIIAVARELQGLHESLKQFHRRPQINAGCTGLMNVLPLLPRQDVCLILSELYFDNLEHCFRILHRGTFNRQLHDFFHSGDLGRDSSFVAQLLAVVSMGALLGTQAECVQAVHAHEGRLVDSTVAYLQDYLGSLTSKNFYCVSALQTKMLLVLLRWMRLDKNNDLWRALGDVVRHALIINLDQDPSELRETFTPLEAEMRRKLWTTIAEEDMMLSILRNLPCLVPDFTCKPPLNVNDDELLDHGPMPVSRPRDEWTDGICQYVLAQSLKDRLHACRDLTSTQAVNYNHVLEHTRAFEKILETLPAPLRFSHQDNIASKAPARLVARMELDISIRRPLMYLYSPFAHANDEQDEFSEARAGYLQSCLMLDIYQDLFDPKYSELAVDRPEGYWDFFYNLYRNELHQAVSGICLELKRIATSSQPDTPVPSSSLLKVHSYSRASLIHAVKDSLEPMIRRVTHLGGDLKEISFLTIVFNSVKTANYDQNAIIDALEELVAACRSQFQRDNVPILANPGVGPAKPLTGWTPGPANDVAWDDLANFPLEFDYGNELNFDFT